MSDLTGREVLYNEDGKVVGYRDFATGRTQRIKRTQPTCVSKTSIEQVIVQEHAANVRMQEFLQRLDAIGYMCLGGMAYPKEGVQADTEALQQLIKEFFCE